MERKKINTTRVPKILLDDYPCKMCNRHFETLQECLKHELLDHSLTKNRPHKTVRNQLQAVLQSLKDDENVNLQTQLKEALSNCRAGEELKTILKFHCVDTEKLEQSYLRIYTCLDKELAKVGRFKIHPFGSVANGLALKSSDIDLYVENEEYTDHTHKEFRIIFNRVSSYIFRSVCFSDVVPIRQARVPIIKCKHIPSGFSIDINMSCPSSVNNTNFLRDLIRVDSRLHQVMLFLKIWCKSLQIIGRGNMTSYCLITLVIFYLQNTENTTGLLSIIPSIQQLQTTTAPDIVQGVNYAYDLRHIYMLDNHHSVRSLIEGFFLFYSKFDFMNNIISPFLARAIPRQQFITDQFNFKEYKNQLRTLSILRGIPALPLQTEHCMCVQDLFCLNLNIARAVALPNFEYLRRCLTCAASMCSDSGSISDALFYENLLYGIVKQMAEIEEPVKNIEVTNTISSTALSYSFTPSRVEMRALAMHMQHIKDENNSIRKLWVKFYIEVIAQILIDIYNLDIQTAAPTHCLKNQKLEVSELALTWVLNGSVDMWSGRMFQGKSSMNFMEQQKALTSTFQKQRRQNSTYAVQLNALLTLNIHNDYSAIEIKVQPLDVATTDVGKKNPLRKFFANLKAAMQSFNLKEKLQSQTTSTTTPANMAYTNVLEMLEKAEKEKESNSKPTNSTI